MISRTRTTIEDVRYLRESPSTPIRTQRCVTRAMFSYAPLVSSITGHRAFFMGAPGGFVRIFFHGAGGNEHERGPATRKRHRTCRDSVRRPPRIAPPIVSRLEAASLRHRRISGLRTLVLIRTRLCLFAPPCEAQVRLVSFRAFLFARGRHLPLRPQRDRSRSGQDRKSRSRPARPRREACA